MHTIKSKLRLLFSRIANHLFFYIIHGKEQRRQIFHTFHERPKYAKDFGLWSDKLKMEPKTAIIIQGPILKEFDFTLETIKIYKKLFREPIIILSTWEDADLEEIAKIRRENIEIILNKKPDFYGLNNINLQIVSSFAGIQRAKEIGVEYAIKTRTDQRIYAPNSLEFLRNILEVFPLEPKSNIQKQRIVGVGMNTRKYLPYALSDMTTYGNIDDLLLFWNPKLDDRILSKEALAVNTGKLVTGRVSEIYLVTEFIKKLGYAPKMTIADSWDVFAKFFCIVDETSLDLYWHKYARYVEHRDLTYKDILNTRTLTFAEWLNLYVNRNNKTHIPEDTLRDIFTSAIKNE